MNKKSKHFLIASEEPAEVVGEGVTRQILGYDESLMMARVEFDQGSIGYVHEHPHAQVTYVESGAFDFMIGGETRRLESGDCAFIPPDAEHGAVCLEAGVLIDVFSPCRVDFLTEQEKT